MKRGNALIVLLVLLVSVSIFSTGLYANFLDTFTGNSFSFVTGNMVSVTGNTITTPGIIIEEARPASSQNLGENNRIAGERVINSFECRSNSRRNDVCWDPVPSAQNTGINSIGTTCSLGNECSTGYCMNGRCRARIVGLTCSTSNQCEGSICSNGICGIPARGTCRSYTECLSYNCAGSKCQKTTIGANVDNSLSYCATDNDCYLSSNKCLLHRCRRLSSLKNYNDVCIDHGLSFNEKCLSGTCTNGKCAKSQNGELCERNTDCSTNYVCNANKRCSLSANGAECTIDSECTSNYCNPASDKCALKITTPNIVIQVAPIQREADGTDCDSDNECISTFCDQATDKCAAGEQVNAEDRLVRLRTAINNALNFLLPRIQGVVRQHDNPVVGLATLGEWRTSITDMGASMQSIEDQICAESFRHPEIENEGLPCTQQAATQFAQAPIRSPQIRPPSIFERLGLFRGANP